MLDLKRRAPDVRRFVATLEEWLIRTLGAFNVRGERREDRIGVWVRAARQGRGPRGQDRRDRHPAASAGSACTASRSTSSRTCRTSPASCRAASPTRATASPAWSISGTSVTMPEVDMVLRREFEALFGATGDAWRHRAGRLVRFRRLAGLRAADRLRLARDADVRAPRIAVLRARAGEAAVGPFGAGLVAVAVAVDRGFARRAGSSGAGCGCCAEAPTSSRRREREQPWRWRASSRRPQHREALARTALRQQCRRRPPPLDRLDTRPRGPRRHASTIAATASSGPENTASTAPSRRLRTQPSRPSRSAASSTKAR